MPPVNKFEGKQRTVRLSAYLRQYVGGKITPTRLNNQLSGEQGVSRVTAWLNGTRGMGEDTAWEIGRALRKLGADTNEIEALWAGGFFAAIFRLLQQIGTEPDGTRLAVRLFSLLPARMLLFERNLCANVTDVEHGQQYLLGYRALNTGTAPVTELESFDSSDNPFRKGKSYSSADRRAGELAKDMYAPKRFDLYQRVWERVSRGDRPKTPAQQDKTFRGDDDVIDVLADAAGRMKERWVPSLLIVRLWRMAMEWADEIGPRDDQDLEVIPDLFLPASAVAARQIYVDSMHEEMAFQAAYDSWRGK